MTPLLIAALVLLPSPAGPREDFSIEEILSSPFPSELTASPAGGRIAWVMNDRGVRNVFVAEAGEPGGTRTSFDKDDGQELHELAWSPDGRLLAFTRGGPPNPRGDAPNPSSEALAPEQAVYLIGPPGTSARLVGEGHSPALSAEGLLAFVRKREVWGAPVEGGAPALLFHCGGQASSVRFSPDGSRLAFVSERGDHSFVGIFDVKAKTLLYLDPSVDRDWEPAWSKDGTRVAFLRTAASITPFTFGPQRTAEPWSIRVADVATGKGREVFKSDPGTGSHFHGLPIVNQILWGEGDRLVFPWEKTGFLGLFAVSVSGGPAVPLAAGSFEVEFVSLSPDRKTLVFSSNQGDVDRRHIFSVPVAGGPTVPRTEGSGIEWSPVLASDGTTLAYLASEARRPAHPVVLPGAGAARDLAPRRAFVPETALVTPEPVLITSADGRTVHAQLFRPKGLAPRVRVPAVVFFHGGPWRQMLLGWHYRNYYHNAYAMNQYLASRGYIVLSVNYRSGIGYGMEFREALNYGAHGASEFADVLGAGLYLRARPDVDPARVG
ncbi:MAG TPA: DPP IV N-terminal domain-containing protein, partial [Vicinamibacteria bacterium]|nr:DPP IV N-terminal domain-containing protein [Vicinamibacteria bacterium]